MKKLVLILVLLAIVISVPALAAKEELRIYIWSEYMDEQKMPADFEKKFGVKVRLDFFESVEEMMAKLQAGGIRQYDIVCMADYNMPAAIATNLLKPLDHTKIPNLKNLMPRFKSSYFDPDNKYHAPYQWGFAGVVYRKDRIKEKDTQSWSLLFDPEKNPGSFYLLDSQQEMLSIALNYLGYDPNSIKPAELKAAIDLLVKTKKRQKCMGFKGGVGANNEVAAGTVNASIVYNGDALRVIDENPKALGFVMPNEGSFMFLDSLVIPKEAPNPEAAYKWINWILDPKVGAELSNYNRFGTPNQASLPFINEKDLKNPAIYPSEQAMKKIFYLKDPGENMKILDQAWTRIKSQ